MPEVLFSYAIRSHHSEARDNNSSLHATVTLLLHRWHLLRILRTGLIGVIGLPWLVVLVIWVAMSGHRCCLLSQLSPGCRNKCPSHAISRGGQFARKTLMPWKLLAGACHDPGLA